MREYTVQLLETVSGWDVRVHEGVHDQTTLKLRFSRTYTHVMPYGSRQGNTPASVITRVVAILKRFPDWDGLFTE